MAAPEPRRTGTSDNGPGEDVRRPRLPRNVEGPDLAEAFLATAVVAVLGIRAYPAATGYPQVGGSTLHIAHMLWGGLGMLAALLMLLLLLGSRVRLTAAVLGGAGFGTFIDELGKFLTQDNDYFFEPAIALIYAVFVTVFLIVRAVPHRPPTRAERLGYAYAALTDQAIGRLTPRRRQQALRLLPDDGGQGHDEQVTLVRDLLGRPPVPLAPPGRLSSLVNRVRSVAEWLRALAASPLARRGVLGLFFLLAGGTVAAIVLAFVYGGDLTPPLTVATVGSAVSALVIGVLSVIGVAQLLRGARTRALTSFYRASQVSIFFAQFFAFVAVQLLALVGLVVNVVVLLALRAQLRGTEP